MCRVRCLLEVSRSHRELLASFYGKAGLSARGRGALPLLGLWARWRAVFEGTVLWMARNSNALSLCAGLHELIYVFVSVSTVTCPCSLSSVLLGFALFVSVVFLKLLALHVFQTVLWWDWLLLPERLANSVKFSICQAYSSNYLLVTPIFSSCEENFTMFLFFAPVISLLLCTITCVKSFRCGLFCHVFGFHQNLSAFHVLKSSLEERK